LQEKYESLEKSMEHLAMEKNSIYENCTMTMEQNTNLQQEKDQLEIMMNEAQSKFDGILIKRVEATKRYEQEQEKNKELEASLEQEKTNTIKLNQMHDDFKVKLEETEAKEDETLHKYELVVEKCKNLEYILEEERTKLKALESEHEVKDEFEVLLENEKTNVAKLKHANDNLKTKLEDMKTTNERNTEIMKLLEAEKVKKLKLKEVCTNMKAKIDHLKSKEGEGYKKLKELKIHLDDEKAENNDLRDMNNQLKAELEQKLEGMKQIMEEKIQENNLKQIQEKCDAEETMLTLRNSLEKEKNLRAEMAKQLDEIREAVQEEVDLHENEMKNLKMILDETESEKNELSMRFIQEVSKYEKIIATKEKRHKEFQEEQLIHQRSEAMYRSFKRSESFSG